jgi:hypothetical protein
MKHSFLETLFIPYQEVIKTYVKLSLINVNALGWKHEKAGSLLSIFGTDFRKHKERKDDFLNPS